MLAGVVATLLLEAKKAMEAAGTKPFGMNEKVQGLVGVNPTGIGLTHDAQTGKIALLVHAGRSRFGIGIANPNKLGQALLAASASPASRQ